jgi:6-phosphogluconolactonase (cycloisomerase 2 family)
MFAMRRGLSVLSLLFGFFLVVNLPTTISGQEANPQGTQPQPQTIPGPANGRLYALVGGQVCGYNINSSTGALSPIGCYTSVRPAAVSSAERLTVDPFNRFVYVGSYQGGNSVVGFTINPSTGVLTEIPGSPFATTNDPRGLTIDPTGSYIFFADSTSPSVEVMQITPVTGVLTNDATKPAGATGFYGVAASPSGNYVYFSANGYGASFGSGPIAGFSIGSGGALTTLAGSPYAAGTNLATVVIDPTGTYLYAGDSELGAGGRIFGYTITPGTGVLVPISGSPWNISYPAQSLSMDPTGRFLYACVSYGNPYIVAYTINPFTGALTAISGSPFNVSQPEFAIVADPTGQYLYGAGWTYYSDIFEFNLNTTTGALTVPGTGYAAATSFGMAVESIPGMTYTTVTPTTNAITTAQSLNVLVTLSGGIGNATPTGSVTLSGGGYNSGSIALTSGRATITIPAGALAAGTDTLTAVYTPDGNSPNYNTSTGTTTVTVTGAAPVAKFNASSLNFSTIVGTSSAAQTIQLSNTGGTTMNISSIALTGTGASAFALSPANTCGSSLTAGNSCSIYVTFSPTTSGTFSAAVSVTDNASGSPQSVSLSGAAISFTLSASPTTQTLTAGIWVGYTITVSAQNGAFTNAVALSVSGAPTNINAAMLPNSVTPGSTSATSTLTCVVPVLISSAQKPGGISRLGLPVLAFIGICVIPAKLRRRWLTMVLLACVSLGAMTAMCSCNAVIGTEKFEKYQPGNYTLTVTGTSGSITQTTTVQLVLQ